MFVSAVSGFLFAAGLSQAMPLNPRLVTLDPAATAEAQVRDNTATRAFSSAPITTSDGQCLFVVSGSGDFRENLTPVEVGPCDGSAGQQWDVITAGVHNDQPGQALIVSSLTQACLNFDPRRAAGNQVLLFSCGGRADGGGAVTNSQLFAFDASKTSGVPLVPDNAPGTLLTVTNGALDQTSGDAASASGLELFTFGGSAAPAAPAAPASSSADAATTASSSADAATTAAVTTDAASTQTASATAPIAVSGAAGVLNPSAAAEANPRDDTATRALSSVAIKTGDGNCLAVDATAGDFRENLIPIEAKACDGSAGQQWDVITAGVHNDQPGQALFVSTLTQGCMNFDPRRAAGNQVLLFSCGGRADGGGAVTNSQLFAFDASKTSGVPLVPDNAPGTLLTITNGALDQTSGDATSASGNELFTFGDAAAPAAAAPAANTDVVQAGGRKGRKGGKGLKGAKTTLLAATAAASSAAATSAATSAVVTSAAAATTPAPAATEAASATAPIAVSGAAGVLNPSAAAEANPRDDTATRALSGVAIKTGDGNCLSVDATAGDFRENLIPIEAKACDGSAGQQWDVITAGVHNDQPGQALLVSTLTQGCMNFDPRRAAGNQVLLFSCGGRADGGGAVTNSQLFAFDASKTSGVPLVPDNAPGTLLTITNGALDQASGDATSASGNELFTFA